MDMSIRPRRVENNISFNPTETPLTHLPRFSARVGAPVYIKQDDVGPISWAGTKARKVKELLREASEDAVDVLVMCGPPQSNSCRALAAGAVAAGIRVILLLRGRKPTELTGNIKIVHSLGAEIRWAGEMSWPALERLAEQLVDDLSTDGLNAGLVPPGCSSPSGAAAIVNAGCELMVQLDRLGVDPAQIIHASASGGMHAGLAIAHAAYGMPPPTSVMIVRDIYDDVEGTYARLIRETCDSLAIDTEQLDFSQAKIDWSHVGEGYGISTEAALEAGDLLARTEGLLVEPVYTGKALAAVVQTARAAPGEPLVFWHSGGLPAYFA